MTLHRTNSLEYSRHDLNILRQELQKEVIITFWTPCFYPGHTENVI